MVYAEVDNNNFNKRYKYTTFAKSQDRRMFRAVPRRIVFLYGNKFLLKDDNYEYPLPCLEDRLIPGQQILFRGLYDRVSDSLYNPRQLLTTGFGPVLSEAGKRIMQEKRRKADEQHRKHMGKLYKGSKFEKYFTN